MGINEALDFGADFVIASLAALFGRLAFLVHSGRTITRADLRHEIPVALALGIVGRGGGELLHLQGFALLASSVLSGMIGPAPFIRASTMFISITSKQKEP